jgi:hypothetical protein
MSRTAARTTTDREERPAAAKPAWRLPGPPPNFGPPSSMWKWLLAGLIVLQAAWIAVLIWMAAS